MFYADKDKVLVAVKRMQREHCAYDPVSVGIAGMDSPPPSRCDCKYGYAGRPAHGENTGCPELSCVVELLNNMTTAEYDAIIQRNSKMEGI